MERLLQLRSPRKIYPFYRQLGDYSLLPKIPLLYCAAILLAWRHSYIFFTTHHLREEQVLGIYICHVLISTPVPPYDTHKHSTP